MRCTTPHLVASKIASIREADRPACIRGHEKLQYWIEEGQYEEKKKMGRGGLCKDDADLASFKAKYEKPRSAAPAETAGRPGDNSWAGRAGLRLRFDHSQGSLHVAGEGTALLLLRAKQREPY